MNCKNKTIFIIKTSCCFSRWQNKHGNTDPTCMQVDCSMLQLKESTVIVLFFYLLIVIYLPQFFNAMRSYLSTMNTKINFWKRLYIKTRGPNCKLCQTAESLRGEVPEELHVHSVGKYMFWNFLRVGLEVRLN